MKPRILPLFLALSGFRSFAAEPPKPSDIAHDVRVTEEILVVKSAKAVWSLLFEQKREAFTSTGRIQFLNIKIPAMDSEELVIFFGTQMELIQCKEVKSRADARVHSLHPNLPPEAVRVTVALVPRSATFAIEATGASPDHTRAYLDALMDEYVSVKREMRRGPQMMADAIADELVRIEKEMKQQEEELRQFPDTGRADDAEKVKDKIARMKSTQDRLNASLKSVGPRPTPEEQLGLRLERASVPKRIMVRVRDDWNAAEPVMPFVDWWSGAQRLWLWFVGGGTAFFFLARRRPWWGTLGVVLALSLAPLCLPIAWIARCNAVLGGWLTGLVLNRIGAWCVFRVRKEALA